MSKARNTQYVVLGPRNKVMGKTTSATPAALKRFFDRIKEKFPGKLKNEFFDVLTADGSKSGKIKLRDIIHREGDWHGAFHLHVFTVSNGRPFLLLQKRRHDKDVCPNKLDTVAAGHYAIGEEIQDGVREVEEEIGLKVSFEALRILGKRKNYDPQPEKGIFNCEFQDVALYQNDVPLEAYSLQESELAGLLKVDLAEFISLMGMRTSSLKGVEGLMFGQGNRLEKVELDVTRGDVWPANFDNYYLKTAILISMLFAGREIPERPFERDVSFYL